MNNFQTTFSRWFRSEVAVSFSVGLAVAAIILWFFGQLNPVNTQIALLNQSVNNIKNNDLTHIELEINSINTEIAGIHDSQSTQDNKLTEIITILNRKF